MSIFLVPNFFHIIPISELYCGRGVNKFVRTYVKIILVYNSEGLVGTLPYLRTYVRIVFDIF